MDMTWNEGAVVTVEAFFIPKAQKSMTGVKQSQGAAVFFDYCGTVHHSYAPDGQTINKEYYLGVIQHLHDAGRHTQLATAS
jgi:hypothetical protein